MGRKSNVNPNHYKTAGREKPGQAIHHEVNRQKFAEAMSLQNEQGFILGRNHQNVTDAVAETRQVAESNK